MNKILDKNMAVLQADTAGLRFYSPDSDQFALSGFAWRKPSMPFHRFAGYTDTSEINDKILGLSKFSAGGTLRFNSDTRRVVIKASFKSAYKIVRMALTGIMGFDIYVRYTEGMIFRGVTAFDFDAMEYCVNLFKDNTKKMREYLIHFPLYAELESLEIGLDDDATFDTTPQWKDPRPVVCYGTSILQGACANRPGMAYPAIMSRNLGRPVLNFGFAGAALGEAYMAKLLSEVDSPCCFLLDYDPNSSLENTRATLSNFIKILRQKHPAVPIVFVSKIPFTVDFPEVDNNAYIPASERARIEEELLQNIGQDNLHFISGNELLGDDYCEASVDNVHISDYGFIQMGKKIGDRLEEII